VSSSSSMFIDHEVGVRLKISALWVVLLFLYAYGDIFGFFKPGQIRDIVSGEVSGIDITEGFLFAVSFYVAIASVMIFLTLVLRPARARWSNVVLDDRVRRHDRRGDVRRVGLLLVPERPRDRGAGPDRSVLVDVAPRDERDARPIGVRSGLAVPAPRARGRK
jgi:Family of unknown function (DUF6326)